ncbi:hypothetical protein GYA49_02520 [Candidatus Beckwithbacteria bacterium]|nr:hypothetical protein [Candidatus Beckwithbacteria bacterium]
MESILTLDYLHSKLWFQALPSAQKELLQQSLFILEDVDLSNKTFYDYSFIIMPAAKAYEGFVKDLLLKLQLISQAQYEGRRFRVGKALNPQLAQKAPDGHEILYDDLAQVFRSEEMAAMLWQTWKLCRNRIFHYFVKDKQHITLPDAKKRLQQIVITMEEIAKALAEV